MKRGILKSLVLVVVIAASAVAYAGAAGVKRHPEMPSGQNLKLCGECHTDERAALAHSSDFAQKHGFYAERQSSQCSACHAVSFCNDCHAGKEILKPSDKHKESPWRESPHRGDYLTQHRIDGKLNPASCLNCHGRRNNERCMECHR